jgi:hypothetical protein
MERFRRLYVVDPSGCWLWKRSLNSKGYGSFWSGKKKLSAHRASWLLHTGDIPDGQQVLHQCDNPRCVNPAHLFLGTNADNVADREAKGRGFNPSNVRHLAPTKLSATDVVEIRRLRQGGQSLSSLAQQFGVCFQNISAVINRKTWAHIP